MEAISRPGRIAAYTTAVCIVGTSGAFLIGSWDDLICTSKCSILPGLAALLWLVAIMTGLAGIAVAWRTSIRPTLPDGSSGWTSSLVVLFSVGIAVAATRLPSYTCEVGHLNADFHICIDIASGSITNATSWIWLKFLIASAGLGIGILLRKPTRIHVAAPLAASAWLFGFGWLLFDTVAGGSLRWVGRL